MYILNTVVLGPCNRDSLELEVCSSLESVQVMVVVLEPCNRATPSLVQQLICMRMDVCDSLELGLVLVQVMVVVLEPATESHDC
jgi:hypothetical protein